MDGGRILAGAVLGAGALAAVDPAPFATVALALIAAIASGTIAALYAIRTSRRDAEKAIAAHVAKLHADSREFIDAVAHQERRDAGG